MSNYFYYDELIKAALKEDMPFGDVTTESLGPVGYQTAGAVLLAKQDMVVAGLNVFERVFWLLDDDTLFTSYVSEGAKVRKGDVLMDIEGGAAILLKGERTALNILQHLSGIATKTAEFCRKVEDLPVVIADTRKTLPGMRRLQKHAVRIGGGQNHRYCLSDGVLIKDNHIKAAGGVKKAIEQVRANIPHTMKIEIETERLDQVKDALEAKAEIIMLDNMSLENMEKAVKLIDGKAITEASGDVNLDRVRDIALTGVDIISIGELTHTVKAANISMKIL